LVLAGLLVLVSFGIILTAAELFTNSVEWFGHRLGISEGAVGSVLAAVGTAMPETMIPIIAIVFSGSAEHEEIGVGAILGAPFLLSTAAFAVTGFGVLAYSKRRSTGNILQLDAQIIKRDLGYFFVVYSFAIVASFLPWHPAKIAVVVILLCLYCFYLYRTFNDPSDAVQEEDVLAPLYGHRLIGGGITSPHTGLIVFQLLVALGLMIGGAQLFVTGIQDIAEHIGVPALALSLVLAPLATELPEKVNSVIWVRQGKDTLAMGNISGAMVFQSCIPVAVGIAFTKWELEETALVSAAITLVATALVYYSIRRHGFLSAPVLARSGIFWVAFVVYVVVAVI
jgi:cation:H+ antiporter